MQGNCKRFVEGHLHCCLYFNLFIIIMGFTVHWKMGTEILCKENCEFEEQNTTNTCFPVIYLSRLMMRMAMAFPT